MTCDVCRQRPATVHYSQTVNGEISEIHVCEACAKEKGMGMFNLGASGSMGGLLSGLIDAAMNLPSVGPEATSTPTPCSCGLTLEEFKRTGFLGCPNCYQTFKKHLAVLLKRIHGAAQHKGSAPANLSGSREPVAPKSPTSAARGARGTGGPGGAVPAARSRRLKRELAKAISEERFEKAAELRDEIKKNSEDGERSHGSKKIGERDV